jgi:hypothetical protein
VTACRAVVVKPGCRRSVHCVLHPLVAYLATLDTRKRDFCAKLVVNRLNRLQREVYKGGCKIERACSTSRAAEVRCANDANETQRAELSGLRNGCKIFVFLY